LGIEKWPILNIQDNQDDNGNLSKQRNEIAAYCITNTSSNEGAKNIT